MDSVNASQLNPHPARSIPLSGRPTDEGLGRPHTVTDAVQVNGTEAQPLAATPVDAHEPSPPPDGDLLAPNEVPEVSSTPTPSPTTESSVSRAASVPGLDGGQLGNFNAVIDAVNASGLEGEAAHDALLVLTTAARQNNFSALTGAPHQLRDGTTGLFNLPAAGSVGHLTAAQRNDVATALDLLFDPDNPGSLAGLIEADPEAGLGTLSDRLGIASNHRPAFEESIDFLVQADVLDDASADALRAAVAQMKH